MDKIEIFSNALWSLHQSKLLTMDECKEPVKAFIRQASECSNYHCSTHYRSREVELQLQGISFTSPSKYHKYCSAKFSHEHMVPVEVLYQLIIQSNLKRVQDIENLLRRFAKRATITKDQNKLLRKSTMPESFYNSLNDTNSHLARYIEAKIDHDLVLRTRNSWV